MDSKVAIVGDPESIAGFKPLGVETFVVKDPPQALGLLEELSVADFAIIFITEPLYEFARPARLQISRKTTPAIVPVPPLSGSTGVGAARLVDFYSLATGARPKDAKEAS